MISVQSMSLVEHIGPANQEETHADFMVKLSRKVREYQELGYEVQIHYSNTELGGKGMVMLSAIVTGINKEED